MQKGTGVSYEDVAKVAQKMYESGIKPTVESVIGVTGGKRVNVTSYLKEFNAKRHADVNAMAQELDSTKIARAIAEEYTERLDQKVGQHKETIKDLQFELDDLEASMKKHSAECDHLVELAEARANDAETNAQEKIAAASKKIEEYERRFLELEKASEDARKEAEAQIKANEATCQLKLENAEKSSAILVSTAETRADKAESEAVTLREQIKLLAIDQAQIKMQEKQSEELKSANNKLNQDLAEAKIKVSLLEAEVSRNASIGDILDQKTSELADAKTAIAKLETKIENFEAESKRTNRELTEAKAESKKVNELSAQLVETQKQLSQAQTNLIQSERERDSLTLALKKSEPEVALT